MLGPAYVGWGGRTLLTFTDHRDRLRPGRPTRARPGRPRRRPRPAGGREGRRRDRVRQPLARALTEVPGSAPPPAVSASGGGRRPGCPRETRSSRPQRPHATHRALWPLAGGRVPPTSACPQVRHRRLSGQVVREVARGKHLLLRTDAGTTLHTHFQDGGHLAPVPAQGGVGAAPTSRSGRARTAPGEVAVGFRLAICEAAPHRERARGGRPLGPDVPSAPTGTRPRLSPPTRTTLPGPSAPPCFDQRAIAGPGNV